tara:strand:- start:12880 stop:13083 length:204 start_codon:yes stop_codon:yes gene_type:complete
MFIYLRQFGTRNHIFKRPPPSYQFNKRLNERKRNWGKELYKGKYGCSLYGEPGIKITQSEQSVWWIP